MVADKIKVCEGMSLEQLALYKKHKKRMIHKNFKYDPRNPAFNFRHADVLMIKNEIHNNRCHIKIAHMAMRQKRMWRFAKFVVKWALLFIVLSFFIIQLGMTWKQFVIAVLYFDYKT